MSISFRHQTIWFSWTSHIEMWFYFSFCRLLIIQYFSFSFLNQLYFSFIEYLLEKNVNREVGFKDRADLSENIIKCVRSWYQGLMRNNPFLELSNGMKDVKIFYRALCPIVCYWNDVGRRRNIPFTNLQQSIFFFFFFQKCYCWLLVVCPLRIYYD